MKVLTHFKAIALLGLLFGGLILGHSPKSYAGGGAIAGGGGVGYKCADGHVYLADTYAMFHKNPNDNSALRFQSWNSDHLAHQILKVLKIYLQSEDDGPSFAAVDAALSSLQYREVPVVTPTGDAHIETTPCGGTQIQLARQDEQGVVEIAPEVKELPVLEQALLKAHEARLRWMIQNHRYQGDTTIVRSWISTFMFVGVKNLGLLSMNGVTVTQDFPLPPVCYRGRQYGAVKYNVGVGEHAYENFVRLPMGLVKISDLQTTPGVPGEACPAPAAHPDRQSSEFIMPGILLPLDERLKIDNIVKVSAGEPMKLIVGARFGDCTISTKRFVGSTGRLSAYVAQKCSFFDANTSRQIYLSPNVEIELAIPVHMITGSSGSGSEDFRFYDVDAPLVIFDGALNADGSPYKPGNLQRAETMNPGGKLPWNPPGPIKGISLYKQGQLISFASQDPQYIFCFDALDGTHFCTDAANTVTIQRLHDWYVRFDGNLNVNVGTSYGDLSPWQTPFKITEVTILAKSDLEKRCGQEREYWQLDHDAKSWFYTDVCDSNPARAKLQYADIVMRSPVKGSLRPKECGTDEWMAKELASHPKIKTQSSRKNIEARIANCGETRKIERTGITWKLVSRKNVTVNVGGRKGSEIQAQEAWLDTKTGLIWSGVISDRDGETQFPQQDVYGMLTLKRIGETDKLAWFENDHQVAQPTYCGRTPFLSDLTTRLPMLEEYDQADDHGFIDFRSGVGWSYWTSTYFPYTDMAWWMGRIRVYADNEIDNGNVDGTINFSRDMQKKHALRCVGYPKGEAAPKIHAVNHRQKASRADGGRRTDVDSLQLKDGGQLFVTSFNPDRAPYQHYLHITKVNANEEVVKSFGKNGELDSGDGNPLPGEANNQKFVKAEETKSGNIRITWQGCYQSTFSSSGGCDGTYVSTFSANGKPLSCEMQFDEEVIRIVRFETRKTEEPFKCENQGLVKMTKGKLRSRIITGFDEKGRERLIGREDIESCYSPEDKRYSDSYPTHGSVFRDKAGHLIKDGRQANGYNNDGRLIVEASENFSKKCRLYFRVSDDGQRLDEAITDCTSF